VQWARPPLSGTASQSRAETGMPVPTRPEGGPHSCFAHAVICQRTGRTPRGTDESLLRPCKDAASDGASTVTEVLRRQLFPAALERVSEQAILFRSLPIGTDRTLVSAIGGRDVAP
jgi:hypothetical protein